MFFLRKPKVVTCALCGKTIAPKERRYAMRNWRTKAERHEHVACHESAGQVKA